MKKKGTSLMRTTTLLLILVVLTVSLNGCSGGAGLGNLDDLHDWLTPSPSWDD